MYMYIPDSISFLSPSQDVVIHFSVSSCTTEVEEKMAPSPGRYVRAGSDSSVAFNYNDTTDMRDDAGDHSLHHSLHQNTIWNLSLAVLESAPAHHNLSSR